MPGLIVPGGAAAATGNLVHLAIVGGIKAGMSVKSEIDGPARKTAEAIVTQIKAYYTTSGWTWPADK
jgi:hypothetical protein